LAVDVLVVGFLRQVDAKEGGPDGDKREDVDMEEEWSWVVEGGGLD
jgi:hypothetical protein